MINDENNLIIRSKSRFIRIWTLNSYEFSPDLDNIHEITSFTFKSPYIITCDVNNEIRYFYY